MPIQYDKKIAELVRLDPCPRVAVETGTYKGAMTLRLANAFEVVHTIELSDKLHATHPPDASGRVTWHHGDTRDVLPRLCVEICEPVLWFLDAHFFSGVHAAGQGALPLWAELKAISKRPYADVVAVDDVHTFGMARPKEYGDWVSVNPKAITKYVGRCEKCWTAHDMCLVRRSPL